MEGGSEPKGSRSLLGKRKNLFLAGKRSLKNGGTGQKCKQKHWSAEIPQKLSFIFLSQRREYSSLKHSSLKEDWVSSDPVGKLSAGEKFLKN